MSHGIFSAPTPINEPVLPYSPGSREKSEVKAELKVQSSNPIEIPLVINGKPGEGNDKVAVTSPHKHQMILGHAQQATANDVKQAIEGTLSARKEWAALPWESRAAVFLKAADLLATKYRAKMNAATMLGQSKTVHQAEIDAACELIDFFKFNVHFMEQVYQEQPQSDALMWNRSAARGLEGFVFAVTPFNFTSIAINLPTAPALMGCSVLWKPAPTSMLSSHIGYEILREAGLPDGVINMVTGDPQMIGEAALKHPELSGVHFTGSTATFNYLWATVGKNVERYKQYPRVVGETGGKDFVFAHPSADPETLVTALVRGAFEFQGQKCSAASRAYIPKSLWTTVKEQLIATTRDLKMGDPEDFTNFMAAVIDERSFDKISGYIERAKTSQEAEVIVGGECDKSEGYFVRPTVIETTNPKYESMVQEIFGPVLTVFVYDDAKIEETLDLVDQSTPYALTGAIFARDRHDIHRLTHRLEHAAGNFYINDKPTGAVVGQQPFGGARASGTNDKAGSKWNLLRWTSMRTLKENFVPPTAYEYPYMGES